MENTTYKRVTIFFKSQNVVSESNRFKGFVHYLSKYREYILERIIFDQTNVSTIENEATYLIPEDKIPGFTKDAISLSNDFFIADCITVN